MLFRRSRTYLDWAAAAPVSPSAELAFVSSLRSFGNPSSPHQEGIAAHEILEGARTRIARLAESKPDGVVFTSGATEANNLMIQGRVRSLRKENKDVHLLYMPGAHASTVETVKALAQGGVTADQVLLKDGAVDIDDLKKKLKPDTRLFIMDGVCGETGTVFDTRGVRNALDTYAREQGSDRPLLHVDATQMPLGLSWDLTRLNADSLALDAQKIGGVRGIGALIMRSNLDIAPVTQGGGQEQGLRPGTPSPALAAAFATALEEAEAGRKEFISSAESAREQLTGQVQALDGIAVNVGKRNVSHILNLSLMGRDTDYLVMLLDTEGYAVSTRSACETDAEHGSRAVFALTHDPERAQATLRVSWGPATRPADLVRFGSALVTAVRFLDAP